MFHRHRQAVPLHDVPISLAEDVQMRLFLVAAPSSRIAHSGLEPHHSFLLSTVQERPGSFGKGSVRG